MTAVLMRLPCVLPPHSQVLPALPHPPSLCVRFKQHRIFSTDAKVHLAFHGQALSPRARMTMVPPVRWFSSVVQFDPSSCRMRPMRLRDSYYIGVVFSPKSSLKSGSGAWHGPSGPVPASADPLGRASAHRLAPSVTMPQPSDPLASEIGPMLGESRPIVRSSAPRLAESSPLVPPPAPPLGESGPRPRQSAPMLRESALMVRHESPSLASEEPSIRSKPLKK